jgi:hypothetical protein
MSNVTRFPYLSGLVVGCIDLACAGHPVSGRKLGWVTVGEYSIMLGRVTALRHGAGGGPRRLDGILRLWQRVYQRGLD